MSKLSEIRDSYVYGIETNQVDREKFVVQFMDRVVQIVDGADPVAIVVPVAADVNLDALNVSPGVIFAVPAVEEQPMTQTVSNVPVEATDGSVTA